MTRWQPAFYWLFISGSWPCLFESKLPVINGFFNKTLFFSWFFLHVDILCVQKSLSIFTALHISLCLLFPRCFFLSTDEKKIHYESTSFMVQLFMTLQILSYLPITYIESFKFLSAPVSRALTNLSICLFW